MHTLGVAQEGFTRTKEKTPGSPFTKQDVPGLLPSQMNGGRGPAGHRSTGGGRCQEHFQTHTARVPPKYRYRRFFTS